MCWGFEGFLFAAVERRAGDAEPESRAWAAQARLNRAITIARRGEIAEAMRVLEGLYAEGDIALDALDKYIQRARARGGFALGETVAWAQLGEDRRARIPRSPHGRIGARATDCRAKPR
jgi:hypothetical protein